MNNDSQGLCSGCQHRSVEFVIAFDFGPNRVRSADICGLDLAGFPSKITCGAYRSTHPLPVLVPDETSHAGNQHDSVASAVPLAKLTALYV